MSENHYLLSPMFSLPNSEEIVKNAEEELVETEEFRLLKAGEIHFLSNDGKGKLFIINPTIHAFLTAFKEVTTLEAVITQFAEQAGCTVEQITPVMNQFFKDMCRRGMLVRPEEIDKMREIHGHLLKMDKIGTVKATLENYEINEIISSRNLIEIYAATRKSDGKKLVIKAIVLSEAMSEKRKTKFKRKFAHEFKLMADIGEHPNVCGFYEYQEFELCAWAAIEHVHGVSVRKFVSNGTEKSGDKEQVIRQMIAAIAHVQKQDILHGDIHNSNFLVAADLGVKLIDFDLANRETPQEGEVFRNGGVYSFIPPERISLNSFSFLKQQSTPASEVFQLGVIAYYVLYGKMPFGGFTWPKLAKEILTKTPEFLTVTNEGMLISGIILDAVKIAMQKDPKDRFDSAAAMLEYVGIRLPAARF